jgi:hypothetical protein
MITSDRALAARTIYHQRHPKLKAGISSNGDNGLKLVVRVGSQEEADSLPQEIDGVPVEYKVVEIVKRAKAG